MFGCWESVEKNKNLESNQNCKFLNDLFLLLIFFSLANQTIHNCTKIEGEKDYKDEGWDFIHIWQKRLEKKRVLYFLREVLLPEKINRIKDQSFMISGYVLVWSFKAEEIKKTGASYVMMLSFLYPNLSLSLSLSLCFSLFCFFHPTLVSFVTSKELYNFTLFILYEK